MRYMLAQMGTTLTLLLIVIPSIFSANSSLQQEFSIQSTGNILIQDNFAETIFFEYGAESGVLQPPWDDTKSDGVTYGTVEASTTHVRTGTNALYYYQKPPPKNDNQRRANVKLFGTTHQKSEGYLSWWIYVDSQFVSSNPDWGPTLGGWQLRFGPINEKRYRWYVTGRFGAGQTSKRIKFAYGWGTLADGLEFSSSAVAEEENWMSSYDMDDYLDQWVHLQVYWKIAQGGNGAVRAWFNNNLIAEKTGITSDPRGFSEWNNNPFDGTVCEFLSKNNGPYPNLIIELYQGENSFENWMWVDDIVGATEKVP